MPLDASQTPRSKQQERRRAMLKVARAAFLEDGYARTSVSSIAARVGGSKATLYAYFPSKEQLFAAVLDDLAEDHAHLLAHIGEKDQPPRQVLGDLGRWVLAAITSEEAIKLYRLVIAEAEHFPALGRLVHDVGMRKLTERLGDYLRRAAAAGRLRPLDPPLAARQFLALCRAGVYDELLWNLRPAPPAAADIEADVAAAAATFLAAFGVEGCGLQAR